MEGHPKERLLATRDQRYFATHPPQVEPGYTLEIGAQRVRDLLMRAAAGEDVAGPFQNGSWVNTCAVYTCANVGRKTVKFAKQKYDGYIQEWQGQLRWRAEEENLESDPAH